MITLERLITTTDEVHRFLRAAELAKQRLIANDNKPIYGGCREMGALRRASLDLSQALVELRKA